MRDRSKVGVLEMEGPKPECSPEIAADTKVNESPQISGNEFDGVKDGLLTGTGGIVVTPE